MNKIDNLKSEIARERQNYPLGSKSQIISLSNLQWDLEDELIPVNYDLNQVSESIRYKVLK